MSPRYKKRKLKNHNESGFSIPANYKFVITIGAIVIVGLAYYIIGTKREYEIRTIGYKVNTLRQEIQKARDLNSDLKARLAEIKKLDRIIAKLNGYGVKLTAPPLNKVFRVKLYESVEGLESKLSKQNN